MAVAWQSWAFLGGGRSILQNVHALHMERFFGGVKAEQLKDKECN